MVKVTTEEQQPLEYPDKCEYQQMKAIMHGQKCYKFYNEWEY